MKVRSSNKAVNKSNQGVVLIILLKLIGERDTGSGIFSSFLSFRAKGNADTESRENSSNLVLNPRSSQGQALIWNLDPGSNPG